MLRVINTSIISKTELAKKVLEASKENTLVIITKEDMRGGNPVYSIYASPRGRLEAGQIVH